MDVDCQPAPVCAEGGQTAGALRGHDDSGSLFGVCYNCSLPLADDNETCRWGVIGEQPAGVANTATNWWVPVPVKNKPKRPRASKRQKGSNGYAVDQLVAWVCHT